MGKLTKFWDTNNMHRIFVVSIRPINQWKVGKYPYTYDLGIALAMPEAGDYLTKKPSVMPCFFFWFFKFFVTFCYFFIACNFHKLLFTVEKGQGYYFIISIHCLGGASVPWFSFLFFTVEKGCQGFFFQQVQRGGGLGLL